MGGFNLRRAGELIDSGTAFLKGMNTPHLVIACGGTGGHFYPTVAIGQAFQKLGGKVTLLVAGKHFSTQMDFAERQGIDALAVPAVQMPTGVVDALTFPFRFAQCYFVARRCIRELKPDLMLGMGSYASVATCLARPSHIPLVLHEGNAFMGKANRLLAGRLANLLAARACAVGLSLPLEKPSQCCGLVSKLVGMPLRSALLTAAAQPSQIAGNPDKATILIFGGSQGARAINGLLEQTAPLLRPFSSRLHLIHLTGTDDNDALINAYHSAGLSAEVLRAEPAIEKCYQAADLVICRGGASNLCELALFGKPVVVIPLPTAADDHQSANARYAVSIHGAIHLPQAQATPQKLLSIFQQYLENPAEFRKMGENLHAIAKTEAAQEMASFLFQLTENR